MNASEFDLPNHLHFEQMPLPLLVWRVVQRDPHPMLRLEAANPCAKEFLGRPRAQALGRELHELAPLMHPTTAGDLTGRLARLRQAKVLGDFSYGDDFIAAGVYRVLGYPLALNLVGMALPEVGVAHPTRRQTARHEPLLAHHDSIRGQSPRELMLERLAQALEGVGRSKNRPAVLYLGVDYFQRASESFGPEAGDALLGQVAQRLVTQVRKGDTVARMDEGQFGVLLAGVGSRRVVNTVVTRLLQALAMPFTVAGQEVYLSGHVGIGMAPAGNADAATLLQQAHTALQHAKGSAQVRCFYTPTLKRREASRFALESDLRRAVQAREFELYYQPVVELGTLSVRRFEALLRWRRRGGSRVLPSRFVPVLEDTGLIMEVGRWVVEAACAHLAAWRDVGLRPVPVAVNVSPVQFRDSQLVPCIRRALEAHVLPAEWLEVEVTESALMENPAVAIAKLEELRELRVAIALDDFGTGYSSLAYLGRLPITTLKIPRPFVERLDDSPTDAAVLDAAVRMAQALGLEMVAEGIETRAQLAHLRGIGCTLGQGYLFARPMSEAATRQLLRRTQDGAPGHTSGCAPDRPEPLVPGAENLRRARPPEPGLH